MTLRGIIPTEDSAARSGLLLDEQAATGRWCRENEQGELAAFDGLLVHALVPQLHETAASHAINVRTRLTRKGGEEA